MGTVSRKPFDANALFSDAISGALLTISTVNSSSVDLGVADADEFSPGICIVEAPALTSGGSATVTIALQDSADDSSFATIATYETLAFDSAELDDYRIPVPPKSVRRYIRLTYTTAVAVCTGGSLTAGFVKT